jgi:hypothetical protein
MRRIGSDRHSRTNEFFVRRRPNFNSQNGICRKRASRISLPIGMDLNRMDRKFNLEMSYGARPLMALCVMGVLVVASGCQPDGDSGVSKNGKGIKTGGNTTAESGPESGSDSKLKSSSDSNTSDNANEKRPPNDKLSDKWYSLRMQGAKVGHVHTRVERDRENPKLIHWHSDQTIATLRNKQALEQRIVLDTWEEPGGRLRKWTWEDTTAGQKRSWTGVAGNDAAANDAAANDAAANDAAANDGDQGFVVTSDQGVRQPMEWKDEWRGFFGQYQVLFEMDFTPGTVTNFNVLLPLMNQVAEGRMEVIGREAVDTSMGRLDLVRIDSTLKFSEIEMQIVYWVDDAGDMVKEWVRQGDITMERTVKEIALAANEDFDLYDAVNVKVSIQSGDVHGKTSINYLLRRLSGEPLKGPFLHDASQQVTENSDGSLSIRVRKITPESHIEAALVAGANSLPTAGDLEGNTLIEVKDAVVQEMAGSVARDATDPWDIARELERMVHGRIRKKNLSQGFNSAATTAKLLEGDCTEHAVLLAAVCRARQIPCRVAVGLVYARGIMAYHMWNEVWIEDRWVPLDATMGRGYVGPGHIKVQVSDLDGIAPFAAFVPVLELIGDLEIEFQDVE